ncbi:Gfo/Idh/MocA family protein [Variovorax saccharolyticus]|uniref:Gfo/Idh/MocA family protein n=1 Tax=Variovorax saccharolyticus TaxID=3053516 RepID=UPI0025773DAF|nr:Gfo/Idh/MocA family oxidoreductase [Variovorax sp. J22R187]MDM0019069.1 Gfo/Idh/MocA family oxidoreductase [Variovorax sp. J22R187]
MIRFGVIGIDHRHVFHLIEGLLRAGATCAGYLSSTTDPRVLEGVRNRFPQLRELRHADELLQDPAIDLIVTAGVPSERAQIAMAAMRHGKDVLTDKPGVVSHAQLEQVRSTVRETGRLFAICFSERMIVPSVATARRLIADGAIGEVIQTLGLGPHRLNQAIRPAWFFDKSCYGGILVDIASHQIDQFLVLTGSRDAKVNHAGVAHFGKTTPEDFEDFGEIALASASNGARGYIRVDWFTPDGLPTWGDGRLFVAGTEGSIEIRKYVDIAGREGTDHLFLCDRSGARHLDCTHEPITFFDQLVDDVKQRTQSAISHEHAFTVCRLALDAQARAQAASEPSR